MASIGLVKSFLNALSVEDRKVFAPIFEHVLDTYQLGTAAKAANFSWFQFSSTTPSSSNTEFSIEHALNQTPSWIIPVLDLNAVNSQLVPLKVTRAPDARRVYLSSPSTSAVFTVFLEV